MFFKNNRGLFSLLKTAAVRWSSNSDDTQWNHYCASCVLLPFKRLLSLEHFLIIVAFKCISPVTPSPGFQLSGISTAWLNFTKRTVVEVAENVTAKAMQDKKNRVTGSRVISEASMVSSSRIEEKKYWHRKQVSSFLGATETTWPDLLDSKVSLGTSVPGVYKHIVSQVISSSYLFVH